VHQLKLFGHSSRGYLGRYMRGHGITVPGQFTVLDHHEDIKELAENNCDNV
jgi:hypothetical protein